MLLGLKTDTALMAGGSATVVVMRVCTRHTCGIDKGLIILYVYL